MMTTLADPVMTAEEFGLLDEFIVRRFGLHFPEHRRTLLESRLRSRVRQLGVARYMDYYLLLQGARSGELAELTRLVTNNETYFFRETQQFEGLFGNDGPTTERGTLRLLCAGCSSGEEAYTLNIFARERRWGLRTEIDAFDLDDSRVAVAREATYGPTALRAASPEQRDRYFTPVGDERYALRPAYRDGVRFAEGNIVDLHSYPSAQPYDAIFCRNVLIYFSEESLARAVRNFARLLRPGGLLFLGHAETIIGLSAAFEAERIGPCIAYRRTAA